MYSRWVMEWSQVEQAATNRSSASNSIQRRCIEIMSSAWKSLSSSSLVLSPEGRNTGSGNWHCFNILDNHGTDRYISHLWEGQLKIDKPKDAFVRTSYNTRWYQWELSWKENGTNVFWLTYALKELFESEESMSLLCSQRQTGQTWSRSWTVIPSKFIAVKWNRTHTQFAQYI